MKLKNILLTAMTPFLLNCKDATAPTPRLTLTDYACLDENCQRLGRNITHESTRPLRFVSVASYPGIQDYRWDINWQQFIPEFSKTVEAKVWIEAKQQKDYTTVTWNLSTAPKVEFTLSVKVLDQTEVRRWRPISDLPYNTEAHHEIQYQLKDDPVVKHLKVKR